MVVNTNEQPKQRNWCKNDSRTQILREFKELHLDTFPSGGIIVCGEVDSKNGNGRYTGFRRFYSTGVTARFKEDEPKIFDDVYTMICSK